MKGGDIVSDEHDCPWNGKQCRRNACELWNPGVGSTDPGECSIKGAMLWISNTCMKLGKLIDLQLSNIN